MPMHHVTGDPLLTTAQTLLVGYNVRARHEMDPLGLAVQNRYPTAFAAFRKQTRRGRIKTGTTWIWRETKPRLALAVIRESNVGATRLRFVDAVALSLSRDYQRENITSLAIAPLGRSDEWDEIQKILARWLGNLALPVVIYDRYAPDNRADETR